MITIKCVCGHVYYSEADGAKCSSCGALYAELLYRHQTPSVSIIMAVKGRLPSLKNSLISWSGLDYPDYELIVVDDRSFQKEELKKLVLSFSNKIKNLKLLRIDGAWEKHRVPTIAWNYGMKRSTGEFVVFAMGDFILSSKQVLWQLIKDYKGYRISVLAYFLSKVQTDALKTIPWQDDPKIIESLLGFWEDKSVGFNKLRLAAGLTSYLTAQYRKDWEWFGGFRDEEGYMLSDVDLHAREQCLGLQVETASDVCIYHQWHPVATFQMVPGYIYETEAQARLLELAERHKE